MLVGLVSTSNDGSMAQGQSLTGESQSANRCLAKRDNVEWIGKEQRSGDTNVLIVAMTACF
jgi:hypothetical protein